MSVNNQVLKIPASVFYQPEVLRSSQEPNPYYLPDAIFDSGTSFTILADQAYQALAQAVSLLCRGVFEYKVVLRKFVPASL